MRSRSGSLHCCEALWGLRGATPGLPGTAPAVLDYKVQKDNEKNVEVHVWWKMRQ